MDPINFRDTSKPAGPQAPVPDELLLGGRKNSPINLRKPQIQNADGSVSTERTITIGVDDHFVNIPTIVGGRDVGADEAIRLWRAGENPEVGTFGTQEEAEVGARQRSDKIGAGLRRKPESELLNDDVATLERRMGKLTKAMNAQRLLNRSPLTVGKRGKKPGSTIRGEARQALSHMENEAEGLSKKINRLKQRAKNALNEEHFARQEAKEIRGEKRAKAQRLAIRERAAPRLRKILVDGGGDPADIKAGMEDFLAGGPSVDLVIKSVLGPVQERAEIKERDAASALLTEQANNVVEFGRSTLGLEMDAKGNFKIRDELDQKAVARLDELVQDVLGGSVKLPAAKAEIKDMRKRHHDIRNPPKEDKPDPTPEQSGFERGVSEVHKDEGKLAALRKLAPERRQDLAREEFNDWNEGNKPPSVFDVKKDPSLEKKHKEMQAAEWGRLMKKYGL